MDYGAHSELRMEGFCKVILKTGYLQHFLSLFYKIQDSASILQDENKIK